MKNIIVFILILAFGNQLSAQDTLSYAYQIEQHREHYKQDFIKDERSPLKEAELAYLRFFEPDSTYAIAADFELTPDAKPFEMATYSGMLKPYQKYGVFTFKIDSTEHQLAVYRSLRLAKLPGFKDYLFLPFRDWTNGETTYGGGRYLDFKTTDIVDGKMILDFNKCYNPWCHYSDGYNCPIPPKENHLEVEILAGERNFGKEKKH
jgi:uncharacterized protein (DUF1684 family)